MSLAIAAQVFFGLGACKQQPEERSSRRTDKGPIGGGNEQEGSNGGAGTDGDGDGSHWELMPMVVTSAPATNLNLPIPDNDSKGASHTVNFGRHGIIANIVAEVAFTHDNVGQVEVVLRHPSGVEAVLKAPSADQGSGAYGKTFYLKPTATTPTDGVAAPSLSALVNRDVGGDWQVRFIDRVYGATGFVHSVRLTVFGDEWPTAYDTINPPRTRTFDFGTLNYAIDAGKTRQIDINVGNESGIVDDIFALATFSTLASVSEDALELSLSHPDGTSVILPTVMTPTQVVAGNMPANIESPLHGKPLKTNSGIWRLSVRNKGLRSVAMIGGSVAFMLNPPVGNVKTPATFDVTDPTSPSLSVNDLSLPRPIVDLGSAGDIDGDGKADIITGAGAGGGPHVKVISGADDHDILSFFAYSPEFSGGVRVGACDLGSGSMDVLSGAGPTGGPHVAVLSGKTGVAKSGFFAFDTVMTQGIFVACH